MRGMWVLFRKKGHYFLLCAMGMVAICMMGNLLPVDDREYSVLSVILEQPEGAFQMCGIRQALGAGMSGWMYILMPVVSFPFASYLSEEKKSRFTMYQKIREGTAQYLLHRAAYAALSSMAVLAAAASIYTAIVCYFFDVDPGMEAAQPGSMESLGIYMAAKAAYLFAYGTAISLLVAFFVYLHNDLYVDLSLAFVANYIGRDIFSRDIIAFPLVAAAILCCLLAALEKAGQK